MSRPNKDGELHRVNGALLDVESAADYLGLTEKALRHLIERGAVPALRLRGKKRKQGRIYLRRQSLENFLAQRERDFSRGRGPEAA